MLTDTKPWATIALLSLVVIVAGVGGAVVIWGNPGVLSFERYIDLLKSFAIAIGILGVGRGIASYGRSQAQASATATPDLLEAMPLDESVGVSGPAQPTTPQAPPIEG
jgi:hypothetical protein